MRIFSDFHDYYDCVQAMGQDERVIYVRNRQQIKSFPFPVCSATGVRSADVPVVVRQYIIGFCGMIYPVLKVTQAQSETSAFCYNITEVDAFLESRFRKKDIDAYKTPRKHWFRDWYRWPSHQRRDCFVEFFKECAAQSDKHENVFFEHRCPVFVAEFPARRITLNACLKDLEFYRLRDTNTTFQEIYMYLGGVLGLPNKPIPDVNDLDMRDAKGFDKWSFRKSPTKR